MNRSVGPSKYSSQLRSLPLPLVRTHSETGTGIGVFVSLFGSQNRVDNLMCLLSISRTAVDQLQNLL